MPRACPRLILSYLPSQSLHLFPLCIYSSNSIITPLNRNYRTREFRDTLFELLHSQLKLPGWSNLSEQHKPSITISKVSGSLTNAVFFVSCPSIPADLSQSTTTQPSSNQEESAPTVLLRIYGPSSGTLISRKEELHLLHTLSATYGIGPLLLGTFDNGRVEQFFQSRPLTKEEVRDPQISTWIARKMSELHSVDLSTVINYSDQDPRTHSQSSCRANSLSSDSKWLPTSIASPTLNPSASRECFLFQLSYSCQHKMKPIPLFHFQLSLHLNCVI
jgi:choline kinase